MKYLMTSLLFFIVVGGVAAEEETLKFRLITRQISTQFIDAANVEGVKVGSGKFAGVAVFDDGRLADKQFVLSMDNRGDTGSYAGYSTYIFQTGDTLTLSFEGGWDENRSGGDYTILSGTGVYEGATGTGRFDAMKNPWENASLYDVTIQVKRSGS